MVPGQLYILLDRVARGSHYTQCLSVQIVRHIRSIAPAAPSTYVQACLIPELSVPTEVLYKIEMAAMAPWFLASMFEWRECVLVICRWQRYDIRCNVVRFDSKWNSETLFRVPN